MTRLRGVAVRDFALDPQIRELRTEDIADPRRQLCHAPDFSFRREVQFELFYFFSHWTSHRITVRTTLSRIHVTTGK